MTDSSSPLPKSDNVTGNALNRSISIIKKDVKAKHFFVLVHGHHGSPDDFLSMEKRLWEKCPNSEETIILRSKANFCDTQCGVDKGGRRLAEEVATHLYEITGHSTGFQAPTAVLKNPNPVEENDDMYHSGHRTRIKKPIDMGLLMELENSLSISEENDMDLSEDERSWLEIGRAQAAVVSNHVNMSFSIVGHSLGGLFARNALGWLYRMNFLHPVDGPLRPISYVSMCTPHLGSRRVGGSVPRSLFKSTINLYLNHFDGPTGRDLILEDGDSSTTEPLKETQLPILMRMTEPARCWMKALKMFSTRTAVSLSHFDLLVPYCSSAMSAVNPYDFFLDRKNLNMKYAVVGISGFDQFTINKFIRQHMLPYSSVHGLSMPSLARKNTDLQLHEESGSNQRCYSTLDVDLAVEWCGLFLFSEMKSVVIDEKSAEMLSTAFDEIPSRQAPDEEHLHCDANFEVEYPDTMLKNLRSLGWRRIDIQFPKKHFPLHHELPIQKDKGPVLKLFIDTEPGGLHLDMLTSIMWNELLYPTHADERSGVS